MFHCIHCKARRLSSQERQAPSARTVGRRHFDRILTLGQCHSEDCIKLLTLSGEQPRRNKEKTFGTPAATMGYLSGGKQGYRGATGFTGVASGAGSGSLTHYLSEFRGHGPNDPAPDWVNNFADWIHASLTSGATDDLLDYRRRAPFATKNHPSEEHLLPLYAALGAAGEKPRTERLHASSTYSILRMDAYSFDQTNDVD